MKVLLSAAAVAAVGLFLQGVTAPVPAYAAGHAACAKDAAMTKEMAMAAADGDGKMKALEHVSMAMEKADASMADECMAEVMKAKAALGGEMMDKMDDTKS